MALSCSLLTPTACAIYEDIVCAYPYSWRAPACMMWEAAGPGACASGKMGMLVNENLQAPCVCTLSSLACSPWDFCTRARKHHMQELISLDG